MALKLRKGTPADAALLASMAEETFRHTYAPFNTAEDMDLECARSFSETAMAAELANPDIYYDLVFEDDTLAAYAKYKRASFEHLPEAGNALELSRIYVREVYKGKGLGKMLIDKANAEAAKGGYQSILLGVWKQNAPALAFYQKLGFEVVGETTFVLGNDPQTDWIMARRVAGS